MNLPIAGEIIWTALAGLFFIAVGQTYLLGRLWRHFEARARRDKQELVGLREDIDALLSGLRAAGERVTELEQRARRLGERQEQLEWRDPGGRPYKQAIELARKGADADELVTSCGLSRGEADLVMMLHQLNRG